MSDKFETMDEEVKAAWVAKLRDPKMKQTQNRLRTTRGMCCLGVLTELAIASGVQVTRKKIDGTDTYNYSWKDSMGVTHNTMSTLPTPVVHWAGLDTDDPFIFLTESGSHAKASSCNDLLEMTFPQIADAIEENL